MREILKRFAIAAILAIIGLLLGYWFKGSSLLEQVVPYQLMVLLAAYILPMKWAVSCGVVYPIVSMLALGTPEPVIALPLAVIQMIALAAFTNFFYAMLAMGPFGSALCSVPSGLVLLFCAASIYGAVSRHAVQSMHYVRAVVALTWPGLVAQLTIGPAVLLLLRHVSKGELGARISD